MILGVGVIVYSLYNGINLLITAKSVANNGLDPTSFIVFILFPILGLIMGVFMIIIAFHLRKGKKSSRGAAILILLLIASYQFTGFFSNKNLTPLNALIFFLLIGCIIYLTFSEEAKKFFNK